MKSKLIFTSYELAVTRADAPVADCPKPLIPALSYARVDMSHCQSKEVYLAFRVEWRKLYAWYSQTTRFARMLHRLECQIGRLEKYVKHLEVAAHFSGPAGELYRLREKRMQWRACVPPEVPLWWVENVVKTYVPTGPAANWLMEMRKDSKIQAQIGWAQAHPPFEWNGLD